MFLSLPLWAKTKRSIGKRWVFGRFLEKPGTVRLQQRIALDRKVHEHSVAARWPALDFDVRYRVSHQGGAVVKGLKGPCVSLRIYLRVFRIIYE